MVADGRPRLVTFRTDALGLVVKRDESLQSGQPHTDGDPHTMFYRFDGREIGAVGNDGDGDQDFAGSIAMRMSPSTGAYKNGAPTQFARFGQTADAITSFAQGSSAGTITANAGDSLQAMALRLWGDASLWYKLAEANALTNGSAIVSGQSLTVPGGIVRTANSASTFRPYDPSEALGDTSPTTPAPQAPGHKKGCGLIGSILSIVVAVAASYVFGPIVGDAISQGFNNLIGTQKGFSFAELGISALTAGVNIGLSEAKAFSGVKSAFLQGALRAGTASVITQGVSVATGLQKSFNWANVAGAAVGGGLTASIGGQLKAPGTAGGALAQSLLTHSVGGVANAAARSLIEGTDFGDNLIAVLPEVIGQTVADFAISEATMSPQERQAREALHAARLEPAPTAYAAMGSSTDGFDGASALSSLESMRMDVERTIYAVSLSQAGGDPVKAREGAVKPMWQAVPCPASPL